MGDQAADGVRLADELAAEFGRSGAAAPRPAGTSEPSGPVAASRRPWIVAGVSLLVILVQIPALRASLAPKPSLHAGVQEVDEATEACIDTLWAISTHVQEGNSAEVIARMPFAEPLTRLAYRVTAADDGFVVECPNPTRHGLKRLSIASDRPMPEAVR